MVWWAALRAYPHRKSTFSNYAILGDDVVIGDSRVAREYRLILQGRNFCKRNLYFLPVEDSFLPCVGERGRSTNLDPMFSITNRSFFQSLFGKGRLVFLLHEKKRKHRQEQRFTRLKQ